MSENTKNNQNVVKCGFAEIDDFFGGFKGGEVIGICIVNRFNETFFANIIYSVSRKLDKKNRKNLPHFSQILEKIELCEGLEECTQQERKELQQEFEAVAVITPLSYFNFCALPYFYFRWIKEDDFKRYTKLFNLFKTLPLMHSDWSVLSSRKEKISLTENFNCLKKDYGFKLKISAIFAELQPDAPIENIKELHDISKEHNLPVFVLLPKDEYPESTLPNDRKTDILERHFPFVDKFVVLTQEDVCAKETNFFLYDKNAHRLHQYVSGYAQEWFLLDREDKGNHELYPLKPSWDILNLMAKHSSYLNRKNFSIYMELDTEESEQFWDYIEVFQRLQFEELYEHIAEYKGDKADKNELFLAASVLYKLLADDTGESRISITNKKG